MRVAVLGVDGDGGQGGGSTPSLDRGRTSEIVELSMALWYFGKYGEDEMPLIDVLKELSAGRAVRGTIELPEYLLSAKISFDGKHRLTIDLDELSLDEPIEAELTGKPLDEDEAEPGDFPD
jgi:hypothetical protein